MMMRGWSVFAGLTLWGICSLSGPAAGQIIATSPAASGSSSVGSSRKSFRPAPTPGQSQLTGRSLDLRSRGDAQAQFYLITPPAAIQTQSLLRQQRAAATQARLRAAVLAQNMAAAQSNRPAGRRSSGSGHRLTLGFVPADTTPLYHQKEVARQGRTLSFVEQQLGASGLVMQREGNRAILMGNVPSEDRSRVAQKMALLEPGIYEVDNRLRIEPPPPPAPHAP